MLTKSRTIAFFKSSINKLLASRGYRLTRRSTLNGAIDAIAKRNHRIKTVIDVGASDGSWTALCMKKFPSCQYYLVEAQPVHEISLNAFCRKHPNANFILKAAGDKRCEVYFDAARPLGGQASYSPYEQNCIKVPMTTIDHEVSANSLEPPFLLKLDTHGFEVPILKGSEKRLEKNRGFSF